MRMAVAGGTGTVGRHVVAAAEAAGHEVVVLSRSGGVDLRRTEGLVEALSGVEAVVDTANVTRTRRRAAAERFTQITGNLASAARAAGARHLVVLSIVGVDRLPRFGYYQAKVRQEQVARAAGLPTTVVRATQFHEFPAQVMGRLRIGPLAPMPSMRSRTVAAGAVGEVLVEVAAAAPGAGFLEVGGPEVASMVDLARRLVRQRGRRFVVVPFVLPGPTGRAMRQGALLPGDGARLVGPTFDEWLGSEDAARISM